MALLWDSVEFVDDLEATFLDSSHDAEVEIHCQSVNAQTSVAILYDVRTVCSIRPSISPQASDGLHSLDGNDAVRSHVYVQSAVSENGKLCLSVGTTVITFAASYGEVEAITQFESDVECLSISEDGEFLLVGCAGGLLNVVFIPQNKCLLRKTILQTGDDYCTARLSNVTFTPIDKLTGVCSILVFTSSRTVFQFNNIRLRDLSDAVIMNNNVEKREVLLSVETLQLHLNCNNGLLVSNFSQNLHLLTMGELMEMLTWPELLPKYDMFMESILNRNLVKVKLFSDGSLALMLDDAKSLHVLCLRTFVVVKQMRSVEIMDFTLLETVDKQSSVCLEVKLLLLVGTEGGGRLLQLHDFPSLMVLYTAKVSSFSALLDIPVNQDSILFIEGLFGVDKQVCALNIREITEAMPEARLSRLLNKRKFDEALLFAASFDLAQEVVYRTKVNYLFEQIPPWRDAHLSSVEIDLIKRELIVCLDKINDVDTVVNCCVGASLLTLQDTVEMLQYARNKLKVLKNVDERLKNRVLDKLEKLETFEVIYGADQFRNAWRLFEDADLLAELFRYVSQGKMNVVSILWDRHIQSLTHAMTVNHVLELLESGALASNSSLFCNWVKVSFVTPVLRNIPDCLDEMISWTIRYCRTMEVDRKTTWPDSAIRFAEDMDSIFRELCSKTTLRSVDLQSELKISKLSSDKSVGSQMQTLLDNMKDLKNLRNLYGCQISLADYSQDDKKEVCCCLLKWIDTPVEIPKFIANFLKPYVQQRDLNLDEILHFHVKNVIEFTDFDCWHWEAAPWERQIIAIIDCMTSIDCALESVVHVLKFAPVPWSTQIEELAQRFLQFDHHLVVGVKIQIERITLKVVLMKHGLQMYDINDSNQAWVVVNRIIKQDGKDAVEDALAVIKFFPRFAPVDVYSCRIHHLILSDKYSEFVTLLKSLPSKMAIACCQHLAIYVQEILENRLNMAGYNERLKFVRAAVHALNRLKMILDPFDFEEHCDLLDMFTRVYALQTEFYAFLTPQDMASTDRCLEIFRENSTSFLKDGKLSDSFQASYLTSPNIAERKIGHCQTTISHLYRLSTILQMNRETALGTLATVAFEAGNIDVIVDVITEMGDGILSGDGAAILFDIVFRFVGQLHEKSSSMRPKTLERLLMLFSRVLSRVSVYCHPNLLERCSELSFFVTVLCKFSYQNPQLDLELPDSEVVSVLGGVDPYEQWVFTPMYRVCDLPVHSGLVLSCHSTLIKTIFADHVNSKTELKVLMKSAIETGHNLILHLSQKGHSALAYHVLIGVTCILIKHGFQELLLSINNVFEVKRKLIVDMLSAVFGQRQMDTAMILGLLLSLPRNDAIHGLGIMEKRCGHKYRKLMALAEIGRAFSEFLNITGSILHFKKMAVEASWGQRLAQFRISFNDAYCGKPKEKMRLAQEMVGTPKMTVAILLDYCRSFDLDVDTVMLEMLNALLTREQLSPDSSLKIDESTGSSNRKSSTRFNMCCQALYEIRNQQQLLETLRTVLEKVGEYDYEVLSFVMEKLRKVASSFGSHDVASHCKKGLDMLVFLQMYRRVGRPSKIELDLWRARNIKVDVDECIGSRLPFHALLGSDSWKIICPELTFSTIDFWLELAPVIIEPEIQRDEMNDKLLVNAVQNIVQHATDRIWADIAWKNEESDADTVNKIFSLLGRIKDPTIANASANFVVHRLPPSYAKVTATEGAIALAQAWINSGTDENKRAESALQIFKSMHTKLHSEYILRSHGLEGPQYLALCDNPHQLIVELYHHPSVVDRFWFRSNKYPNIHDACKEIAAENDCDLDEIFISLLEKWLAPTECLSAGLDYTLSLDFDTGKMESSFNDDKSFVVDEDNLKRAVYLMKLGAAGENASHVAKWMLSLMPGINNEHRFRAAMCLLHSVGENSIESCTGMTSAQVVKLAKSLFCASQMESLRLPCDSVTLDSTARVQILVIQLLQVSYQNPKALELAADLCIESKITAQSIWSTILQRMTDAKMYDELSKTLVSLPFNAGIAWLPVVCKAWTAVLEAPISTGDDTLGVEKIVLFHRCPSFLALDLPSLSETFSQMGLYVLAADCLLHIIEPRTRELCWEKFLTISIINSLMHQLRELRESYGDMYHLDRVSTQLATRLRNLTLPETITKTELFEWTVQSG